MDILEENRISHEVSLSKRYSKMIVWVTIEVKMLRTLRPCIVST